MSQANLPKPGTWTIVLAMMPIFFAGLVDVSHFHRSHNADSLLPSLVSTVRWTPFFWRQDRYGMLAPLLAIPLRNPLYNLLFVTYCSILGGLGACFLLARYLFRRPWWPAVGACSVALMFASASRHYLFENFGTAQFFTTPLALALLALWCFEMRRVSTHIAGCSLMCVASWYNIATPVLMTTLIFCRIIVDRDFPRVWSRAEVTRWLIGYQGGVPLLLVLGFFYGTWCRLNAHYQETVILNVVTPSEWLSAIPLLAAESWKGIGQGQPYPLLIIGIIVCLCSACAATAWGSNRGNSDSAAWSGGATGIVCALVYASLVAFESWVQVNHFDFRFWLPAWLLLVVSSVGLALGQWVDHWPARQIRLVTGASWCIACIVCVVRYGPPSVSNVREDLARVAGPVVQDAISYECTHIGGDYWHVWPAVFQTNLMLYEAGSSRQILGMADRSEDTQVLWPKNRDAWRTAVPIADISLIRAQGTFNIPRQVIFAETPRSVILQLGAQLSRGDAK